ncbi:MAG: DUF2281 domain-containing protein [Desulfoferrobacter sp.]
MVAKIKQKLLATIEETPESKLGEVLDFLEFLLEKERHKEKKTIDLEPGNDPILEYIGGVAHGSLAENIDGELYGERD